MLVEFIVGDYGPLWVYGLSNKIGRSLCGAALHSITNWDRVKQIHDDFMNESKPKTASATDNVINVFDVDK